MERTKSNQKKILCCDPSLNAFGFVVMAGKRVITAGCIKTQPSAKKLRIRKGDDRMRRVSEINAVLLQLYKDHQFEYIISELPHGSQSAVAASALGLVSGLVQTMADFLGLGIEWFSEADSKKCALGKQSATKNEMIIAMKKIYDFDFSLPQYKNEAIADALAIHNVAMKHSHTLKFLAK